MHSSLAEKARAGRRAALSALNARLAPDNSVVSIFMGTFPHRQAMPEFHSVRTDPAVEPPQVHARFVLRNRAAA